MPNLEIIATEITYKAVRSSGAGGQHVNKTSSKVILTFNVEQSSGLSEEEKQLLNINLKSRLTLHNELILECSETRSQHKNKELVFERFKEIILTGLKKPKKRKKTKPTKASKFKRLRKKKIHSEKKTNRRKPKL
ncbi:ribosome-associated protein [Gillisia sp. Hel_I_86]|uniref:alternative ribosome rescue aminoacyl-tRNA hydrolase ArfB n=1 Tax=Gillisia sp. Hel_I_86 TaxID=1249981 RepID=UPI00119A3A7C|nr:alternative ribosome rescue aminoacyl-tRNA hydrolase ArfB [Gillisia sp. Hel_I_86]TVZ26611.1 ribosome-associated protein [Gillisia sp. Hel_I_86]